MVKGFTADRVHTPESFWQCLEMLGVSRQALARFTLLPTAVLLGQADASCEHFFTLWRALPELTERQQIGFDFAASLQFNQLPPELFAASLAKNYRDALLRLARFKRLCAPELITLEQRSEQWHLEVSWLYGQGAVPDALIDTTFAFILELGRRNCQQAISPLRVNLKRSANNCDYLTDYYQCPVSFSASSNALVFTQQSLDLPFSGYNQALAAMIIPQLEQQLTNTAQAASYTQQVMWVVEQFLSGGSPKIGLVAEQLGVSVRTLQRRITQEGHSYQQLLNQVRIQRAKSYLANPTMRLSQIAVLVGYDDQNSFYRAFKQLEGLTPTDWRNQHLAVS